jgi:hypothetical protein
MAKLGRPGFVWVGITSWRKLAVRVIHLGYHRGGSGLGWAIPVARAARGGGHAGVRVFRALQRPNCYGFRCNMTGGREWSSPKGCGDRGGSGRWRTTTTGGGRARLFAGEDGTGAAGPSKLRRSILEAPAERVGGQHGTRRYGGRQFGLTGGDGSGSIRGKAAAGVRV